MIKNQNERLYFYSDPHYGHKNVIQFCERPFLDTDEMTERMIKLYNDTVPPDGICIWLGDCFFINATKAKVIMDQLNGTKILIRGNHDLNTSQMYRMGFSYVADYAEMAIAGHTVSLKHYPFKPKVTFKDRIKLLMGKKIRDLKYMERRPDDKGQWLMHGHTHSKIKQKGKQIHVGVDAWGYKPVPYAAIESIIQKAENTKK